MNSAARQNTAAQRRQTSSRPATGRPREIARHWRAADGIDMFEADYKNFSFPKHSHDYYAFGTVLNGAERFTTRGTNYVAARGQLLMMNPMQVHDGSPASEDGYQYQIMFIDPKVFGDLVTELSPKNSGLPFFGSCVVNDPELHLQLQGLHRLFRPNDDGSNGSNSLLERDSQLLYSAARLALRHADAPPYLYQPGSEDKRVRAVIDYMAAHLDANISLDDLAMITGLSRFHLLRVFRAATGLPPHTYFNHMRLRRAKRLLFDGASIADAAAATGFADQSHLNRHFKAMWGVSPGAFIASLDP
ncbi:AraC family transcriptional regulator [Thalassospira sp. ER-Se-21-Dark]|uniref:AraC family transcriptional regulator n=1 Tax=Thalassospira sp. ER-Se-21-Dark TaxID=2585190 RepID=UPI001B30874C|nr:AraC family transcriptional regulator [Thalassospira sp. ER-Se-21-Dark]MBP3127318.1 AraC family transcriptional regulator [Thalassospira sp. ER-Se-21-Dark]